MTLSICNMPPNGKFKGLRPLPALGLGTIWFGRRWPIDNKNYVAPSDKEIESFLMTAHQSGIRMFDTAAAYGTSEKSLGAFFKKRPNLLDEVFIATKWGEDFDINTEESFTDHSIENLAKSFGRSQLNLPKIDLLYIHKADSAVLGNKNIQDKMFELVTNKDIKYTGASISNRLTLKEIINKDRLWTDFLQTSADVVAEEPGLIKTIYNMGVAVVVNSPVRKQPQGSTPKDSYLNLANNPNVSFILTGTRTHLEETIGYFERTK